MKSPVQILTAFRLLLVLAVTPHWHLAQNADSLKHLLAITTNDTSRGKLLLQLIEVCTEYSELPALSNELIRISAKNPNNPSVPAQTRTLLKKFKAGALSCRAFYGAEINGDFKGAKENYFKSLTISRSISDEAAISDDMHNIGFIYFITGDMKTALAYYDSALVIKGKLNDQKGVARLYHNIGVLYDRLGNAKAFEYYKKNLRIIEKIGSPDDIAVSNEALGTIYSHEGSYAKALECFEAGLKAIGENERHPYYGALLQQVGQVSLYQKQYAKALSCFRKCFDICKRSQDKRTMASVIGLLGQTYADMGNISQATESLREAVKITTEMNYKEGMATALLHLSQLEFTTGQFKNAEAHARESYDISEKLNYPRTSRNAAWQLFRIDSAEGDYKNALALYMQYKALNDSIVHTEAKAGVIKKRLEYFYTRKVISDSVKIAESKKLIAAQQLQQRNETVMFCLVIAIIFMSGGFVLYRLVVTRRKNRIIEQQKQEVEEQKRLAEAGKNLAETQKKMLMNSYQAMEETQERLKLAKEEAEKANRTKDEFLANISHEIRTPINTVLGFSELLKGRISGKKEQEYLEAILSSGQSLMSLINDILDFSKIEAGHMEIQYAPFNPLVLIKEVRSVFNPIAFEKNLVFNTHINEHHLKGNIISDETRLRQIIFNLLSNAFKFTETGEISLYINLTVSPQRPDKANLAIIVEDTGIGIPEGQQQIIFEAFRQMEGQSNRKYGGTGLGLSITKRLVELMKGRISMDSVPGKGSRFTINLDDLDLDLSEKHHHETVVEFTDTFTDQTVLLVDDIATNRSIIKAFLEHFSIHLVMANDGQDAIDLLHYITPDLILMDIMMPGVDGYEVTEFIRSQARLKHIPVIATTARQDRSDKRHLFDRYILKPVTRQTLIQTLKDTLPQTSVTAPSTNKTSYFNPITVGDIRNRFMCKWQEVNTLKSLDDISDFANELLKYGAMRNYTDLIAYASHLKQMAEEFEIEEAYRQFSAFAELANAAV